MKYCQHCGTELADLAVMCPQCGCSVSNGITQEVDESVSVGLVVLAVFIPLFGLIYWPVKSKTRPRCAKACGIAALISWGIGFVFSMISNGLM